MFTESRSLLAILILLSKDFELPNRLQSVSGDEYFTSSLDLLLSRDLKASLNIVFCCRGEGPVLWLVAVICPSEAIRFVLLEDDLLLADFVCLDSSELQIIPIFKMCSIYVLKWKTIKYHTVGIIVETGNIYIYIPLPHHDRSLHHLVQAFH